MASITAAPTSGNAIVDAISADNIWGETTLQYMFGTAATLDADPDFQTAYDGFFTGAPDTTFAFADEISLAFNSASAVSGLTFELTTDTATADLVAFSNSTTPNATAEGFFQNPDTNTRAPGDYWNIGVFNVGGAMLTQPEKGGGSYAAEIILHELGHAFGLKHTHIDSGDNPLDPLPEVGKMDSEKYSVMSYNPETDGAFKFGHPVGFMALDIATLQALYGVGEYATGDSTYALTYRNSAALDLSEGNTSIGRSFYSLWDSGGTDTIAYEGAERAVVINLNAATLDTSDTGEAFGRVIADIRASAYFDSLSKADRADMTRADLVAGGSFSFVVGQVGGYSIAHGAEIENALGGAANDFLIGNELANILTGGKGKDTLLGGDGDDTLKGGAGHDILVGGDGADQFVYSGGDDRIKDFNAAEGDTLVGDWPV